jgi:hypothetical protein
MDIAQKNKEIALKDREIDLKDLEIELKNREIELKPMEIALKDREIALKGREIQLKDLEIQLKDREITLKRREIELGVIQAQLVLPMEWRWPLLATGLVPAMLRLEGGGRPHRAPAMLMATPLRAMPFARAATERVDELD